MPYDGVEFSERGGDESMQLQLTDSAMERLKQMIRLSGFSIDLNRRGPIETPTELLTAALGIYKQVFGGNAAPEIRRYMGEDCIAIVSLNFDTPTTADVTGRGALPEPFVHILTLHFRKEAWDGLEALRMKHALPSKAKVIERSLIFFEWGVWEAQRGFEICSPNPETKKLSVFFSNTSGRPRKEE